MTQLSEAHAATAVASIQEDARFIVRTALAFPQLDAEQRQVMAMALLPSFSLISYESRKWLQQHIPTIAQQLPSGENERVATIRHAGKWLGASKAGVDEGLATFRRMRAAHEKRFLGNTPFLWARALESDLGLYRHRGVVVLNTHLVGLVLGELPSDELGPLLRIATESMVRQARLLDHEYVGGPSFLGGLGPFSHRDVRSNRYYGRSGHEDLAVAGYLHVLWSNLAFLRLLEVVDPDDEGPVFKLQFAGLFHAVQSLNMLEPALVAGVGELAEGDVARRLRNDLVHYTPHDRTPIEALGPLQPRRKIVEHAYGRHLPEVAHQLREAIDVLHARLGESLGR
jgi:hypothetical protein